MTRKAFTIEEANQTIPLLDSILAELDTMKASANRISEQLQIIEVLWGGSASQSTNPDHREYTQLRHSIDEHLSDMDGFVRREILGRGLRFPVGGLEHGLIDFPTTFDRRWVFLCWKRGEAAISHWHEIEAGFLGRQEVCAEHHITMGKMDHGQIDDSRLDC